MNKFIYVRHAFLIVYYQLAFITGGILEDEFYTKTALRWMDLKNYKRAIRNLEKALKTYDVSYVRYKLALCYQCLGEYEKAYLNFNIAHEKNKIDTYLIFMAFCKYHTKDIENATKILQGLDKDKLDEDDLERFKVVDDLINNNLTFRAS